MMKFLINIIITAFITCVFYFESLAQNKQSSVGMKTTMDSVSYIIGTNMGRNIYQQNIGVNMDLLKQGIDDIVTGSKLEINDSIARIIMTNFQKKLMAKQDLKNKEDFLKNKAEGDRFLAENKSKDSVITLPDGLQYKIMKKGVGTKPTATDNVKVNYEGSLINGYEFDSSYKYGKPALFQVNQEIKGWIEALQMMTVGSKWILYIPQDLAYGDRANQNIPAGSTLIYKVELLSIEK